MSTSRTPSRGGLGSPMKKRASTSSIGRNASGGSPSRSPSRGLRKGRKGRKGMLPIALNLLNSPSADCRSIGEGSVVPMDCETKPELQTATQLCDYLLQNAAPETFSIMPELCTGLIRGELQAIEETMTAEVLRVGIHMYISKFEGGVPPELTSELENFCIFL
jgi:hypothetical protein